MKKAIILVFSLLITSVAVKAQGHNMWVSGQASFSSSTTDPDGGGDKTKASAVTLGPRFGYNLNPMITIGIGVLYSMDKNDDGSTVVKTNNFEINPFARYNKKVNDNFTVFGELNLGFGGGKVETDNQEPQPDFTTKTSTFRIAIGPGLDYKFSDRFSVSGTWGALSYNSTNYKDAYKNSTFGLGLDLTSFEFALNYHFGK